MKCTTASPVSRPHGARGMTLIEMMIAVGLGSMLLAMAASLWLFGSRSFAAMSNYTDLDARSRNALDQMSRDIRQATGVTAFQKTGSTKWLTVTNTALGKGATYTWSGSTGQLVCRRAGEADRVYLTGCDSWDFELYQRAPQKGGDYVFWPATNKAGAYDLSICKLINMKWKCSRTILGSKLNTESVQTAQVVLRNKQ
jgi:prepilin-type N-terminal cleavage/methylation domain-containing protein